MSDVILKMMLIPLLLTIRPAAAGVNAWSANSCEEHLSKPEDWSAEAIDQAAQIISWIYRVDAQYLRAINTAETPEEFAALYFLAAGHNIPPSPYSPLGNLFRTNHLEKCYRVALLNQKATHLALTSLAMGVHYLRIEDADLQRFAFQLVKSIWQFSEHLPGLGDQRNVLYTYVGKSIVNYSVSLPLAKAVSEFHPTLDRLRDHTVFALVYKFVKLYPRILVSSRFILEDAFNSDYRVESLLRVLALENSTAVHSALGAFKRDRRSEFQSVPRAVPAAAPTLPVLVASPSRNVATIESYLTAPERWANRTNLVIGDALDFDGELERALTFINQLQDHALGLVDDGPAWAALRDSYVHDGRDPRAILTAVSTYAQRNTAVLKELAFGRRNIILIQEWIARQSAAFESLDKSAVEVAKLDAMTQITLGVALGRLELLPQLAEGTQRAFELRMQRLSEESATLGTLSTLLNTRLQTLLAGGDTKDADDPLLRALDELAPVDERQLPPPVDRD